MANPFLIEDNDVTQANSFNPFLSDTDNVDTGLSENPFLSSFTVEEQTQAAAAVGSSNPFSFSASDSASVGTNIFASHDNAVNYDNIFSSPVQPPQVPSSTIQNNAGSLIFGDNSFVGAQTAINANDVPFQEEPLGSCDQTDETPKRPPPPPRPIMPPRETTELIRTVTGAMEATSSHLLDRLQATRTPSPTPMRELHSPSPTHFGDLLDVDSDPFVGAPTPNFITNQQQPQQQQEINLMDDFDLMPTTGPLLGQVPIATLAGSPTAPVTPPPTPAAIIMSSTTDQPQPSQDIANLANEASLALEQTLEDVKNSNQVLVSENDMAVPVVSSKPSSKPPPRPQSPAVTTNQKIETSAEPIPAPPLTVAAATPPLPSRPAPPAVPQRPKPPSMPARPVVPPVPQQPAAPLIDQSVVPKLDDSIPSDNQIKNDLDALRAEESQYLPPQDENKEVDNFNNEIFSAKENDIFTSGAQPPVDGFSEASEINEEVTETATLSENVFPVPDSQVDAFGDTTSNDAFAGVPSTVSDAFGGATSNDIFSSAPTIAPDVFTSAPPQVGVNDIFGVPAAAPAESFAALSQQNNTYDAFGTKNTSEAFDAFTAKFESVARDTSTVTSGAFDPFGSGQAEAGIDDGGGFGADESFDAFLALSQPPPVPQGTPARGVSRGQSADSDTGNEFNVFIKPKDEFEVSEVPTALPPPKSPQNNNIFQDTSPRFNPFDNSQQDQLPSLQAAQNIFQAAAAAAASEAEDSNVFSNTAVGKPPERTDSQETPPTPLFDEDVSQPLEDFPRIHYEGPGWEMFLRQPNKKKITGQRFWKKIWVKLVLQGENPVLQLSNTKDDKDPFQELPLQPCYSVSDIGAQQYDQYGKIFTVKVQFIFYKERPGVRPGQVTKAERITNKLSQFAAYAIQGDYQGVKEFGSDLRKLGLPVEHAPQISQLFKLGSFSFEDMKQFSVVVEEALFKLSAHRDRALNYKMEEVQITAVDELYVDQNAFGGVLKQIARVRLFFLGFLSGMPDVELGVNDLVRQGKEVVGRHDIIPVVTEEWIRLEHVEFHSCIQQDEYERTKTIRFKPPDACYLELMRFRVRPPRNRELPLQLKAVMCVNGNKVELRSDILVPGFTSRKLGQIPCEDIMVRFPIPECWIYLFRVEKHFRYGSVKSAHRRTGKVKGIERFLGTVENMEPSLMEVTSGQAKYEHQHRAIVWRIARLPKEGQGAYTTHNFVCRMSLTSYDQIPEELAKYCYVEFTMPATTVSHMTVRSVSICNSDSDNPPEKYVRQLSRHEYRVEIEHTTVVPQADYLSVTKTQPPPEPTPPQPVAAAPAQPDSDSDSSG